MTDRTREFIRFMLEGAAVGILLIVLLMLAAAGGILLGKVML